ncbi:MAG: hypothetical protein CBB65_08090 [Hyphomonadaceae bacterium TMED5]|nr:hypothetical protein [Ponticaulis sp.]OUY00087.1 MAG: hypothetical protein CBB65_08090 [Hyphomonadaceae bacterium TMED5]|tara:strand:+ start:1601 stop:2047 length:447 start_codon:yes stop_codon:yes gene_type:complete
MKMGQVPETAKRTQSRFGRSVIVIVLIIVVVIGGRFLQSRLDPAVAARAPECLELADEGLAYTNTCDVEINFRYCFTTHPATGFQNCQTIALAPNETSHSLFSEYRAVTNADGVYEYACETPYLPVRIQSYTDRHVDMDACRLDGEAP